MARQDALVEKLVKKYQKAAFKAAKEELKDHRRSLKVVGQSQKGTHNCPRKDAGATHVFRPKCIKLGHGGYCPACGRIVCYRKGCDKHGYRKDELLHKSPMVETNTPIRQAQEQGAVKFVRKGQETATATAADNPLKEAQVTTTADATIYVNTVKNLPFSDV